MHDGVMQRQLYSEQLLRCEHRVKALSLLVCHSSLSLNATTFPLSCPVSREAFALQCFAVGGCSAHSKFWNTISCARHCYLSISMGCSTQIPYSH